MKINEKGISRITGILIAVVALLVIANMATIYYFYAKKQKVEQVGQVVKENYQNATTTIDTDEDGLSDSAEKAFGTDPTRADTDFDGYSDGEEVSRGYNPLVAQFQDGPDLIDSVDEEISVNWELNAKATSTFEEFLPEDVLKRINKDVSSIVVVYLGDVENGFYKDKGLYRIEITEMGTTYFRVIKDWNRIVVLTNYSTGSVRNYGFGGVFYENKNIKIKNMEPPLQISIPNSSFKLIRASAYPFFQSDDADLKALFKYGDFQVYKRTTGGCYVAKDEDGIDRNYYFDFLKPKIRVDGESISSTFPSIQGIEWNNGIKTTDEYSVATMSCFFGCYNYVNVKSEELVKVGEFNGQLLYELKDKNYQIEGNDLPYLKSMHSGLDETKISYADFLKSHPVVFWRDPFGDYIALRNTKFDQFSMAECGKPVIYLYPEKTTDVSVQVAPTGGFTITEPAYNNGWLVKATPNSELYNYTDKQTYPYLFWEGKGYNYQMPNAGFVVKKEEVEKFLVEKLAKLGLIQKEYDEFIEFWLPKMQAKPYYFVTFVPQNDFDKIAPLSVNPKPDTIIRVFMDFQGLDNFVRVPEQKIVTPIRKGFTVVEWGGALHN